MSAIPSAVVCERVRSQISLDLDGELSELERRMVAAHLDRCIECRAFEADVSEFTRELRTAPLEELERTIVVHRPRRVSVARVHLGVAASIAVVAVGTMGQVMRGESAGPSVGAPVRFETARDAAREQHQIIVDGRTFKHQKGPTLAV